MIILDTNVLSEAMRDAPASQVVGWMRARPANTLFTTAISSAEILFGVALLPAGKRKQSLAGAAQQILGLFAGRILPFDLASGAAFAKVMVNRRSIGQTITQADAQIAAIALSSGMSLATRNVSDFTGIGVTVIDPWTAQ